MKRLLIAIACILASASLHGKINLYIKGYSLRGYQDHPVVITPLIWQSKDQPNTVLTCSNVIAYRPDVTRHNYTRGTETFFLPGTTIGIKVDFPDSAAPVCTAAKDGQHCLINRTTRTVSCSNTPPTADWDWS